MDTRVTSLPDCRDTARVLHALPGATGYATGQAYRWQTAGQGTIRTYTDPHAALETAFADADARLAEALAFADTTLAPLLEAQRLMLGDPELRDGAFALVSAGRDPVAAVTAIAGELAATLESAGSEYFRERAIDVRAAGQLVAEVLCEDGPRSAPAGAVVLAEELAPLDTAQLAEAGVAALVTVHGGPTCHAAIIARAWGIPAVVGAPETVLDIPNGIPILVNGTTGTVILSPTPSEIAAQDTPALPPITLLRRVPVYANVGSVNEAFRALTHGAEGIGLLRTEFLFQERATPPSEKEQAEQYRAILLAMEGRPVVIRTLDIGADKPAPFLPLPAEPNPQLGLRGIRLCLRERELFATQLRALLRVADSGPLKIMLPMVTMPEEMREARTLLEELARELGVAVPPLGAMIEVPMAALAAPELAEVSDFFSLGTNDLLQFLLAADRQHAGVGYLHAADHPGVWRLVEEVITSAHQAGIPVGVCGEWGADAEKLSRLVDLGIDSVSVAAGMLPRVNALFA